MTGAASLKSLYNERAMSIRELLDPGNCALMLIDHHPQLSISVQSMNPSVLKRNVIALAKAASIFALPAIYSSVHTGDFSGEIWPEILQACPELSCHERTTINCWEDPAFAEAVADMGRKKLIMAGLWTETHVAFPALQALAEGYEVYVVADACASSTRDGHDRALMRMMQAGAVPVTWQQVVHELQRDWAREGTYRAVVDLIWRASEPAKPSH